MSPENLKVTEVDKIEVDLDESITDATHEILRLDNGAEGMFVKPGGLDETKTHPMVVLIHGGPFGSANWHMFTKSRSVLLMQGFCLLILNYRGSTGYGEDSMNSLLG